MRSEVKNWPQLSISVLRYMRAGSFWAPKRTICFFALRCYFTHSHKVDRLRLTSSSQHHPVLPAKSGSHIWLFPELVKPLAWVHVPKTAPMHPLRRNLQITHCLCYFSCHSDKIPEGSNSIERGLVWLTVGPGREAMVVGVAPFSRNVVW